jgi:hypothetical protein
VLECGPESWPNLKAFATLPPSAFRDADIVVFLILMMNKDEVKEEKMLTRNHTTEKHHGVFVGRFGLRCLVDLE